jgi:hypothetical protein
MRPRDTVPSSTRAIVHQTPLRPDGAVDVFAPFGSVVRAPGDGRVTRVSDLRPHNLPGWQIQGYIKRPSDGKEVPFVLAHLLFDSHPTQGETFLQGAMIGKVSRWREYPSSTHCHWAFGRVGEAPPPPGSVSVMDAFKRFGPMPFS